MSKFDDSQACSCLQNTSTSLQCACPPPETSNGRCGEEEMLAAMDKFRRFYEGKLQQIDVDGGGDCLELKVKVQERWIGDLTEQTQMMARVVKELEEEATARVQMLEDKLKQSSKAAYEVMKRYQAYNSAHNLDEPFQKSYYLESDLKSVLEFVRRIREEGRWTIDGLQFYDVTYADLFGKNANGQEICRCDDGSRQDSDQDSCEKENAAAIENEKLDYQQQLKKKDEEYEALRQSMLDMRSALTEEVACKHDMILALKRDVLQLEERCLQSDKQTAFKDDIIKELRKEIRQLKQQLKKDNEEKRSEEVEDLERKLREAEARLRKMKPCADMKSACTTMDTILGKSNSPENERELEELRNKCREMENALNNSQARCENLQKAVDLYINSINVLEASEERSRLEIEQQRVTINNLQDALVAVKHDLDELRQRNQEVSVGWAARWFGTSTPTPKSNHTKSVHDI